MLRMGEWRGAVYPPSASAAASTLSPPSTPPPQHHPFICLSHHYHPAQCCLTPASPPLSPHTPTALPLALPYPFCCWVEAVSSSAREREVINCAEERRCMAIKNS